VEIQQFGLNVVTIGFVGTVIFALVEAWGLWEQNKTIWASRAGESVSVTWLTYFFAASCAYVVYGISTREIAPAFSGFVAGVLHIPILVGLWKYKGFKRWEKVLFSLFMFSLASMMLMPFKDWFFLVFAFGTIISLVMQPIEIIQNRNSGQVEIRLLLAYLGSTFFWTVYAYAAHDWVLEIVAPGQFVTLAVTAIIWFVYRKI